MSTNYYFHTRNKELVQDNFATRDKMGGVYNEEYSIVDEPYLSYQIHISKTSCGWRPLFQVHKAFKTFKELERFYKDNENELEIYDEYHRKRTWDEYKESMSRHSQRECKPHKWVYEPCEIFNDRRTLHTVACAEEEAELYLPFDHKIYVRTENEARRRFHLGAGYNIEEQYSNDPDYPFDWMVGEFC